MHVRAASSWRRPVGVLVAVALLVVMLVSAYRFGVSAHQRAHTPQALPRARTSPRLLLVSYHRIVSAGESLPLYVPFFLESCADVRPHGIDCLLVAVLEDDDARQSPAELLPCRVSPLAASLVAIERISAFRQRMLEIGLQLHSDAGGRKFADFKPLYGALQASRLTGAGGVAYSHWGWADNDGLVGRALARYLHANSTQAHTFYMRYGWQQPTLAGQVTIFANTAFTRMAWRTVPNATLVLGTTAYEGFDELLFPVAVEGHVAYHEYASSSDVAMGLGKEPAPPFTYARGCLADCAGNEYVFLHFQDCKWLPQMHDRSNMCMWASARVSTWWFTKQNVTVTLGDTPCAEACTTDALATAR